MWGIDAAGFMALLVTVATLVVLEGLLSADNALVLAVMVRHLPKGQQKRALRLAAQAFFDALRNISQQPVAVFRIAAQVMIEMVAHGVFHSLDGKRTQIPVGKRTKCCFADTNHGHRSHIS